MGALLGVKAGTISYRIRNNAFRDHEIDFICTHFGINPEWVKLGIGEIYTDADKAYSKGHEINHGIQDRSITYYSLLTGDELNDILDNEKDYSRKVLIERIRDLEVKLLQAIDSEKLALKREREATDKYLKLLEKSKGK